MVYGDTSKNLSLFEMYRHPVPKLDFPSQAMGITKCNSFPFIVNTTLLKNFAIKIHLVRSVLLSGLQMVKVKP